MNARVSALLRDLEAAVSLLHGSIDRLAYYIIDLANLRLTMQATYLRQAHLVAFEPDEEAGVVGGASISDTCSVELLIGELVFKAKDCLHRIDREYACAAVQRMASEIDAQEKRSARLGRPARAEHVRPSLESLRGQIEAVKGACRLYTADLLNMTEFIEHDTCYASIKRIKELRVDEVAVVKWCLLEHASTDSAAATVAADHTP